MTARLDVFAEAPGPMRDYLALSNRIDGSRLGLKLVELVRTRVSQINGCANCLNMHTSAARKAGETEQRLHLVAAWRDAPVFTERERAALDWAEHLTLLPGRRVPDDVYRSLTVEFDAEEQVLLTLAIVIINGWNRLMVGFEVYNADLGWKEESQEQAK